MVKGCFACGQTLIKSELDVVAYYFNLYEKYGQERYFYKLSKNGSTRIVLKDHFQYIYNTKIKPNLKNGAEYAHISEFKGKSL